MKNKKLNSQNGFSALVFVITMSAILAFLVLDDNFEEWSLQSQLSAVERHYENLYYEESQTALSALESIHLGS